MIKFIYIYVRHFNLFVNNHILTFLTSFKDKTYVKIGQNSIYHYTKSC